MNWCFWIVVLEKTLESPLDCREIQPIHLQGNQFWIFIGRTDAVAETPILWPRDVKNWLIWKDPDAVKDRRQKEKGTTEDEMVGWYHRCNGHEFEQALGVGDGQGSLECCSPWGHKESDTTERLNWTDIADHWTTSFWTCKGPLTCGFFSIVNTRVLHTKRLVESIDVEPWMQMVWVVHGFLTPLSGSRVNCIPRLYTENA